jgi:pumilio RNA-binding family
MCIHLSFSYRRCRVVQKALETLYESDLPRLLTEFHNNVLSCIHDQNGNHVIQKCIEVMSEKSKKARLVGNASEADFFSEQIDFIVDDVLGNVSSLSCHPYGCRVLQRILEHCVEPKKIRALDEISKVHRTLLDDQYGNYVIQHVLQFGRHSDRNSLLEIVVENGLLLLSRQKFASNVVEKLLKYGTAEQRKAVVREMLKVRRHQNR